MEPEVEQYPLGRNVNLWSSRGNGITGQLEVAPHLYKRGNCDRVEYVMRGTGPIALLRRTWPPTNYKNEACRSCGESLACTEMPMPMPESFDPVRRVYYISDVMTHGCRCLMRYALDRQGAIPSTVLPLIHQFAREVYGITSVVIGYPLNELIKYGGPLTTEEYLGSDGSTTIKTIKTSRMVPSSVINELRHHAIAQTQTGPLQPVANKSRVTWSIKGLCRPADLPPNPVVEVVVTKPTEYDDYLSKKNNEPPVSAAPQDQQATTASSSVGQKRALPPGPRLRKRRVIHITPMNSCKNPS